MGVIKSFITSCLRDLSLVSCCSILANELPKKYTYLIFARFSYVWFRALLLLHYAPAKQCPARRWCVSAQLSLRPKHL